MSQRHTALRGQRIKLTEDRVAREKTDFYSPVYAEVHRKIRFKEVIRIWDFNNIYHVNSRSGGGEEHFWENKGCLGKINGPQKNR